MIKRSIYQEDITIINTYAPNKRVPKYIKQTWIYLKGEIDNKRIIIKDINNPLSIMSRTYRQNFLIGKEAKDEKTLYTN